MSLYVKRLHIIFKVFFIYSGAEKFCPPGVAQNGETRGFPIFDQVVSEIGKLSNIIEK